MDTEKKQGSVEIDLLQLFGELLKNWHVILTAAIVGALILLIFTQIRNKPSFTSTTSVYMLAKNGSSDYLTTSELSVSAQMSKDFTELLKSQEIMEKVITRMDLRNEKGELWNTQTLANKISVSVSDNSRVIYIKVTDSDPFRACDLANEVRTAAAEQIRGIMDQEAVNTVDQANVPRSSGYSRRRNALIGAAIGVLLVAAVIVIRYLMNDSIHNEEDVQRYLNLSTIGVIPLRAEDGDTRIRKLKKRFRLKGRAAHS